TFPRCLSLRRAVVAAEVDALLAPFPAGARGRQTVRQWLPGAEQRRIRGSPHRPGIGVDDAERVACRAECHRPRVCSGLRLPSTRTILPHITAFPARVG